MAPFIRGPYYLIWREWMATQLGDRVRQISGTTSTLTTDNSIADALSQGYRWAAIRLPKSIISNYVTVVNAGASDDILLQIPRGHLLRIFRDGVECREVPHEILSRYDALVALSLSSLYAPTPEFPIFSYDNNQLHVRPTGSTTVQYLKLDFPDILYTATDIGNEYIESPTIVYAASLDSLSASQYYVNRYLTELDNILADVDGVLGDVETYLSVVKTEPTAPTLTPLSLTPVTYTTKSGGVNYNIPETLTISTTLPTISVSSWTLDHTEITDALSKSRDLIDTIANINFESLMNEDDPEMARMSIEGAAEEINRANGKIADLRLVLEDNVASINQEMQRVDRELQKYRLEVEKEVGRVRAVIESLNAELHESDQEAQVALQNNAQAIENWSADVNSKISLYRAQIEDYGVKVRNMIEKANGYLGELQVILGEMGVVGGFLEAAKTFILKSQQLYQQAERELQSVVKMMTPSQPTPQPQQGGN